jgi:hypothetical protein
MNYLIELGRKAFHEFNADYKFSKSKGDEKDKTISGATLGAATGAVGAGLYNNRQVNLRRKEMRSKMPKWGKNQTVWTPKGKKVVQIDPEFKRREKAQARQLMRNKYGANWHQKAGLRKGMNRKVLGYGALAGAAFGGIAGRLSRGKKED